MADALAIIATHVGGTSYGKGIAGQEWADRIARQLLGACKTWQGWASLSEHMGSLAEASPDQFLTAVDYDLSGADPQLVKLFVDKEASGIFSSSPHTYLLWALESLAWSPEYLSQAAVLLARLARLEPGGKMENRPRNSLRGIFLLWMPGTTAPLNQRLRVLETIKKREPEVAWQLLEGLIPDAYASATETSKPRWRDWAEGGRSRVTPPELFQAVREVVQRLLAEVGVSATRWKQMIEVLNRVSPEEFDAIVNALLAIDVSGISEPDRFEIWDSIRAEVARHIRFADADWAFSSEQVQSLERALARFEPSDLLRKNSWLFGSNPELPMPGKDKWREHEQALGHARVQAAKAIFEARGIDGILAFAKQVVRPDLVGFAIGDTKILDTTAAEFLTVALRSGDDAGRVVARGYIYARARQVDGQGWLKSIRASQSWGEWSPRQRADYYLGCFFSRETWGDLQQEDSETQRLYWSEVSIFGRVEIGLQDREYAVQFLRKYGRLASAAQFLALFESRTSEHVPVAIVADVLEALGNGESTEKIGWSGLVHEVSKLIDILERSGQIEELRIARLEWMFLSLLEHSRTPTVLQRTLSDSPDFFVEILQLVYRAEGAPSGEVTNEHRARARMGYRLLHKWRRSPGLKEDGSLDGGRLIQWIARVREIASTTGHSKVADIHIGEMLANMPAGKDDVWPHEVVRDLLEEISNEQIESGLKTGIYNKRGVFHRTIGEGGKQEREIAERYRSYARALADGWPRTARMMKEVAASYESNARQVDTQTELEDRLWG